MIKSLVTRVNRYLIKKKWRKQNIHNDTFIGQVDDINLITVGKKTYGLLNVINHNVTNKLCIGSYCSIAPNVTFVVCGEHSLNYITTFPFKTHCIKSQRYEAVSRGNIIVEDDVWIGTGAIIMSGVHIHQGAVIGAGAVVTKDVLPYTIVGGNPAKKIRTRFPKEIIDELLCIDLNKIEYHQISTNLEYFYKEINDVEQLGWLPRKEN